MEYMCKLHQLKFTNKTWIKTSECGVYAAAAPKTEMPLALLKKSENV